MRIYAVADLHGVAERVAWVRDNAARLKPDLLVVAGDAIQRRRPAATLSALAELGLPVLLVAGNGDGPHLAAAASSWASLAVLHRSACWHGGVRFAGIGGTLPLPFASRIAWREARVLAAVAPLVDAATVLIAHPPPHGVRDRVADRFDVGSRGLRQVVLSRRPLLVLCGHVHEAAGIGRLGNTLVVNASMGRSGAGALVEIAGAEVEARMIMSRSPATGAPE
jgi:hypothetical protein